MSAIIREKITEPFMVARQSVAPLKLTRWQIAKLMARTFVNELPEDSVYFLVAGLAMVFALTYVLIWNKTVKRVKIPAGLAVVKRNDMHFLDILKEGRELVCTRWNDSTGARFNNS